MEAVNFEKKGLLAQWQASLLGLQRRDEALQVCHQLQCHPLLLCSCGRFFEMHGWVPEASHW